MSVVKQQEELLDALSDGSDCQSEGQDVVDAAQSHLTEAQQTKTSADTAAATAASAPVDLGSMSLSQLGNGQCVDLRNDPAFIAAKKMNDDAQAAATTAAAELTAAQNALSDAQEAQKEAIKACECKAHQTYESAYAKANTRSDEDLAAWKKGKHMKCVLAGTDPSSCSVGAPPDVTKRTLAAGVDESACAPKFGAGNDGNGRQFPIVSDSNILENAMSACESVYGKGKCNTRGCGGSPTSESGCGHVIVGNGQCNGAEKNAWCINQEQHCGRGCGWREARVSYDNGKHWQQR